MVFQTKHCTKNSLRKLRFAFRLCNYKKRHKRVLNNLPVQPDQGYPKIPLDGTLASDASLKRNIYVVLD